MTGPRRHCCCCSWFPLSRGRTRAAAAARGGAAAGAAAAGPGDTARSRSRHRRRGSRGRQQADVRAQPGRAVEAASSRDSAAAGAAAYLPGKGCAPPRPPTHHAPIGLAKAIGDVLKGGSTALVGVHPKLQQSSNARSNARNSKDSIGARPLLSSAPSAPLSIRSSLLGDPSLNAATGGPLKRVRLINTRD